MTEPRKRVFVGDVQGCADELGDLLEALDYSPERHALWFVGDLVNRGPASARVLRTAIALGADSVLGNHDLHLLRAAQGSGRHRPGDTLDDVLEAEDRDTLLAWLRTRPLVREWDDLILVHAAVHPAWPDPGRVARGLERQIEAGSIPRDDEALAFLTSARHCDARGQRPRDDRSPPAGFEPWDHFYTGARRVVFGHWSVRGRVATERVRGLDTGCVWGGELTAWIAEEDRFVSVPARRRWCVAGAD